MQPSFQAIGGGSRLAGASVVTGHTPRLAPVSLTPGFRALTDGALTLRAQRDAEIVAQGDRADHCYLVVSGCLRTVTLMEDGRRQVDSFLMAGDLFGWELVGDHDAAAEAVTPVVLRRLPISSLEALAERDLNVARRLRRMGADQLRAARERMVLLGRKTALERIAAFLEEMTVRLPADNRGNITLPMGRTDIADHLGLTVETVCRGLTQLRRKGAIALERQDFRILDRSALDAAVHQTLH